MTMPYIQLISYYRQTFDVYTVLDLLTPKQIGDMIIHSDTLTNISLAKHLVVFFQGSSFSDVQMILKEFTQAAIKHKIVVLPNLEVTQLLLTNFLELASSHLEMYTAIDWNITFQQDLWFLAYAFNTTTLTYIIPQDYASFVVIVSRFSNAHDQMSETSKRAVVLWIIHYLKEFKAYHMEFSDEWIHQAWGLFFHDATLEEVKSTHEKFDPKNIMSLRNAKVRLEVLSTILTNLERYFYKFTALDYDSWFLNKLKFLLPSINVNLLQLIPLDVSYSAYRAIFGGLDQVYPELSQDTSLQIYNLMKIIMKLQLNVSGTVFPGSYNSSQDFLQLMFYKFAHFARYTDFLLLYKEFNGFEVLSLLSTKQMGEMMVVTDAFRDEFLAIQILVELEKRPSTSIMDFMIEFNAAAKQKHLIVLPDLRIRDLIFRMVFKTLKFGTFSAEQYSFWFGTQLQLFLTALSPRDLQLIPLDVDCQSHQHLVKAMEKPYDVLTAEQKEAIHGRILTYLKIYQARQGTTCSPDANSTHWLLSNYGRFSALASIKEFLSVNVNFNAVTVLAKLSASQLAELVITLEAWNDGNLLMEIMSHLETMADLAKFLDQLNKFAAMELQSSDNSDLILGIALRKLAVNFAKFKPRDFTYWFQSAFQNVLHAVNRSQMVTLPLRISCDSYQQILKGFDNIYSNIPAENAANIFGFIKAFLMSKVKSGLACGHLTQSFRDWLQINLGNFSQYAEYHDLLSWNLYFDGMAVLKYLSPSQLASFTLESGVIINKEHMCQILAKLKNKPLTDIYEYLDQFNTVAQKLGITSLKDEGIQKQMLVQFLEGTEGTFSTFAPENWTHLLSTRLGLLLPSISEKESQGILSYVSSCDSFRAVVSSVGQVYPSIPLANRKGIYDTLFAFLDTQHKITGSACSSHTKSTESWLQDHLGPFVKQASYEDLTKLLASFSAFEIKDNLTSIQLAHVFFGSNILHNPDMVRALLMPLENRSLEETSAFVSEFVLIASQKGVMFLENTDVRFLMLETFFYKMQDLFPSASVSQYKDWFQSKLILWLPSMNATTLAMIPKTIPCGTFKAIMAGLDGSFPHMSPENCQDVYKFAIDYLTSKISQGGDPCIENTRGSLDWLNANFKHFSRLATYPDLVGLNPDFNALDAVASLSPWQLADYTLQGGVLRDTDKARKVFGALDSQDIAEFMDAFNAAAKQHHLSQLPHLEMRRFILGEIFCHLNGFIHLFTAADYYAWFGQRLHFFLSSLDAQNLDFLPSDLSCDSLAAIVSTLKDHHGNNTFENPEDIYSFIKRVLHFHVQNSDSACAQGISTDRQWLARFFGPFTIYGSYSDFTALKSNFHGSDSLDLFSARTLAEMSVQSHTVYSTSAMKHIFQTIKKKADADQFLGTYLDEFNPFVMKNRDLLSNANIRDALLMLSAEISFPQMSALSLKDMAGWLERLNDLLPGINGTMLELLPLDMSCPYYQTVVKALDSVYSTLSTRKRQDVYGFQKTYLTAQFAISGSACDGGMTGIQDLLLKNFGKFCSMAKLSELQTFYPELNGVEKSPVYISPKEASDFTNIAQMLQNATLARHTTGMIKNFTNYYSLHEYLSRLQRGPCQDTIVTAGPSTCRQSSPAFTVEIQQEILENALFFLKKEGSSMNSSQWREAYFLLFSNILPRTVHLSQMAPKLPCHLYTILKAITALHPSLIKQQEELDKVKPLCFPGRQHPNIKATTHILAKMTKYSYQDETHSKHRIGTFPHPTSKSHTTMFSSSTTTTKQNLEGSPGNTLRNREMDTTGHATIHNLRNTSGFFENVTNKPIPIPGGATKSILQGITTHISGIPRFSSPLSARTNALRDATNDVTRNTTGDFTGNITARGLGRTSRHISGSSRTDISRTTIAGIHKRASRWIPKRVTQISRSDSSDILGRGNLLESAMHHISASHNPRWSTVQMFEKITSGFQHYPKSFASEIPDDITKLENTITHIPANDNSNILVSGTDNNYGNSSTCTTPHNYGGSTYRVQESISANFNGIDRTHIPGYTTENVLMDSGTYSLGITAENNSRYAKSNIREVAKTHIPAGVTVNQHVVHFLDSKNEKVSHSVMKYILKNSTPPRISGAMGMPGVISSHTSRSSPAGGAADNIPRTFTGNILGSTAGKILESITAHFLSVSSSNIPGDAMTFESTTIHIPGDAVTNFPTNNITHNLRGTAGNENEGTTASVTGNLPTGIRSHIPGNALGSTRNTSANTPRNKPGRLTVHQLEDVNSKFLKGIVTNIPEDATIKMSSVVTGNIDGAATSNLPRDVTYVLGTDSNWPDVITNYISKVFSNISQNNALGNIPSDDLTHITRDATDNMPKNIIHTQGNIDTMGNSPRDVADSIPESITTNMLGSIINNVPEDTSTSVHSLNGITSKFPSSITFQIVRNATINILKSVTASVLRSTTEGEYIPSLKSFTHNILHGATGNLSDEIISNVNGGDTIQVPETYDATGNTPQISITHSPGNGTMNYISGGATTPISKSTTGNIFQSTTSNAKEVAMGYDHKAVNIHEGTMSNISGGAIIYIPGGTSTDKNLGSVISNSGASVIYTHRGATISVGSGSSNISSDLTLNISKGTIPEHSTVHILSSDINNTENKTTLFLDGFSSNITIGIPDHIRGNDYIDTLITIPGDIMGNTSQTTISSIASDNDIFKDATPSTEVITPIHGGASVKILSDFTGNSAGDIISNIPINDTINFFKDATVSIPVGSTKHNFEDKATHVHDGSLGNSHDDATENIFQKITPPTSGSSKSTISTHLPGKGNEDDVPGGPNHDSSRDVTTNIFINAMTYNLTSVPDRGNSWANKSVLMSFYCVFTRIFFMVSL
ncbi:uncharacterized protein LOC120318037 isoform X2 [Crotalus tigris]|uniref:uncharacterized protein LOC120318037 isoform X2 n=1 Tax=Crotalus tigris TaxID=88082 RepID=UPI00192F2D7A|nr:uncharacterized protein LOC120318037 isoform X2 [Crotalus tigris]